nr:unnamed protein product [Callosobruchus chinensis]
MKNSGLVQLYFAVTAESRVLPETFDYIVKAITQCPKEHEYFLHYLLIIRKMCQT